MKTSELEKLIEKSVRKVLMEEFIPKMIRESVAGALSARLNEQVVTESSNNSFVPFKNVAPVASTQKKQVAAKTTKQEEMLMEMLTPVDQMAFNIGLEKGLR